VLEGREAGIVGRQRLAFGVFLLSVRGRTGRTAQRLRGCFHHSERGKKREAQPKVIGEGSPTEGHWRGKPDRRSLDITTGWPLVLLDITTGWSLLAGCRGQTAFADRSL
jgi:hypothetical protein